MEQNELSVSKELSGYIEQLSSENNISDGTKEQLMLTIINRIADISEIQSDRMSEENAALRQQNNSYLTQIGSQKEIIASYQIKVADLEYKLKKAGLPEKDFEHKTANIADMLADLSEMRKDVLEKARRQGEQIIADTQASALQLREEGLRQLDLDIQQKKNELDALKKGFWELRKNYKQSFDNTIKHLRDIQSGLGDIIESDAADAQE